MKLSVILTVFEDPDGLDQSLASLTGALRPQDALIVVDAGSQDGSAETLAARLELADPGPGVARQALWLGSHPRAWRALGAAAGLVEARAAGDGRGGDIALLMEAGDRLQGPAALESARQRLADSGAGLLIAALPPARLQTASTETAIWQAALAAPPAETAAAALRLRPVPARMLVRLADRAAGPLGRAEQDGAALTLWHWECCLAARPAILLDTAVLCLPRSGPDSPPQAGPEPWPFAAYRHLRAALAGHPAETRAETEALLWLLERMQTQRPALPDEARWPYVRAAIDSLAPCPAAVWQAVAAQGQADALATALRGGDAVGALTLWTQQDTAAQLALIAGRLDRIEAALAGLGADNATQRRMIEALCRIAEFDALPPCPPEAVLPAPDAP